MATTYIFKFTDGAKNTFQVSPFTGNGPDNPGSLGFMPQAVQADTVLRLYGQGIPDYGEGIEQNLIYMLENFANSTSPLRQIEGQQWFNNVTKELFLYDGSSWGATILASGVSPMMADLNMGAGSPLTNKIINLANPTDSQDAITLSYANANYLNVSGDTINGNLIVTGNITAGGDVIITMGSPINPFGAINKDYADSAYLALAGGTMTGDIVMPVGPPINPLGAISEQYADARYLLLTGGVLSGTLELSADPVNPLEAATMQYVDSTSGSSTLTSISFTSLPSGSPPTFVAANADTMVFSRGSLPDIQVLGLDYTGKSKPALDISLSPPGIDVVSNNVQDGFFDLDINKLSNTGGSMSGVLNMSFNTIDDLASPTTPDQAVNKSYVDNALSPSIYNTIFLTDGSSIYASPAHLGGDNKLQVYVNGQKKYADTYGYTNLVYSPSLILLSTSSPTFIDTSIVDYNFDIQIDGVGGSPIYNIALPTSGSPPTITIDVNTHADLINTISLLISSSGVPQPSPRMNLLSFLNTEQINSNVQGSTSNIVVSNSGSGTYLFDTPTPIPITLVTDNSLGSPATSTFDVAGDQTSLFPPGKVFGVLNSATDDVGQPNFDRQYTVLSSSFSSSPGTTTIELTTLLNLIGNVTTNGDIYSPHIAGLISVSSINGNEYDYSEVDKTGTNVTKGSLTTKIKFTTVPPASEQVEMILFG